MIRPLTLASGSATRLALLQAAGIQVKAQAARVDEVTIRAALGGEGATARDMADALAEMKARKLAERDPSALVLGCDQVLEFKGQVWGKPVSQNEALDQLGQMRGQTHHLHSALVLYDAGQPIWRHLATAKLVMREFSDDWLQGYVARNWEEIRHSAGAYQIESEGIRLFSAVEGDYFAILGLPIVPLLLYLGQRGFIAT